VPLVQEDGMSGTHVDHRARAENVRWLVETGENLTGAAQRLGLTADGLEKWLAKNAMRAELATLRSREPYVPADRREINRRNAEARWAS
jgi:hypothetical protein